MGIDIGQALREGASRTAAKDGLVLAVAFAGIALLTTVLLQSFIVAGIESVYSFYQGVSPQELGLSQAEYNELLENLELAVRQVQTVPLAFEISTGAIFSGLIILSVISETLSIVAVRLFSMDKYGGITREMLTDNLLLAILNGFVGGLVVWGIIILGSILVIIPAIFFAVVFYFVRQEVALKNKNVIQALADSWRTTNGNRIEVFLLAFILFFIPEITAVVLLAGLFVFGAVGSIIAAILGGAFTAFGAAVVTRAYVQIDDSAEPSEPEPEDEPDPYDAALGPDDLPR